MSITLALISLLQDQNVRVRCPVDQTRFQVQLVEFSNQWGGADYDFCRHAFNTVPPHPLEARVWTCPACYFTGDPADFEHVNPREPFERELDAAAIRALQGHLTPMEPIERNARQGAIPGYVKFDLWAQVLAIRGGSDLDIGRAYMYASWCARQRGARRIQYFDEYDGIWDRYDLGMVPWDLGRRGIHNRTDYELDKAAEIMRDVDAGRFNDIHDTLARYIAGLLYRKHGENVQALEILESIREPAAENSVIEENLLPMIESIELERRLQRSAIERLEAAAPAQEPADRGEVLYWLGETRRRLGEADAAVARFDEVIALPEALEMTRYLSRRQRAVVLGEPLPEPPAPPPDEEPDRP